MKGLCAYCGRPTTSSCRICGRLICPEHTSRGGDVCVGCARGPMVE